MKLTKYMLVDAETMTVEPMQTYRSRREERWIAWIPADEHRIKHEWLRAFALRLQNIPGAAYCVAPTQRKAALGLARHLKKLLFTVDAGAIGELIRPDEWPKVMRWPEVHEEDEEEVEEIWEEFPETP